MVQSDIKVRAIKERRKWVLWGDEDRRRALTRFLFEKQQAQYIHCKPLNYATHSTLAQLSVFTLTDRAEMRVVKVG